MIEKKREVSSDFLTGGNDMLRVIICDDDVEFLRILEKEIDFAFQGQKIPYKLHAYSDANQISSQLSSSCDIAVLDIDYENAEYNGLDIARKLRELRKDAVIIFVTNYIEYAPEGYEVRAFRYVLKKEIPSILHKYIHQAIGAVQSSREIVKISVNGEIIDLPIEEIMYFEVQQHSVTVYVKKDRHGKVLREYSFYATLAELERKMDPFGFLRIHKSYLVNMRHIRTFQCREVCLNNGTVLRVSEKNYSENKRKYLLWKGWN